MRRTNCLFWALARWARCGGYLLVRKSRWGPFPHFLWSPDAPPAVESFVPLMPRRRLVPPLLFKGTVRTGDHPEA